MVVIKRDGRKVQFDASKISNAIESALRGHAMAATLLMRNLINKIVKNNPKDRQKRNFCRRDSREHYQSNDKRWPLS